MMTRPTTVLLDTNVWNALIADGSRGILKMIRTRQVARALEVVSCVEVLEEIVGTADKRSPKFEQLRALHGELINDRLVLQIKERYLCELERGRMLSRSERYVPADVRASMDAGLDDLSVARQVHQLVSERKALFGTRERRNTQLTQAWIEDHGHKRKQLRSPVDDAYILDWARTRFADVDEPSLRLDRFGKAATPSAWWVAACMAAQEIRSVIDGWRAEDSDSHDAIICSAAIYADVLVTDDVKFAGCLELLEDLPFQVLSMTDFDSHLRSDTLRSLISSS